MRNLFLAIALGFFLGSYSFSQVDSVSVTVSFSMVIDSTSLDTNYVAKEFMTANVWVNDPDFVGKIMISSYDLQTGHPLSRVKYTSEELESNGLISGNVISIPLGFFSSTSSFTVKTRLQNFQLGYLPEVVINYP